jgi:thiamine pyrophosphate-dependent acetolactate synthase large subunit-like protein
MKKLIAIATLAIILLGGYFGYQNHKSSELVKALTPTVKEATIRTKTLTEVFINPSNQTFGEIFKAAEENLQKISDLLITVESQNTDANPQAIAAAVEYLKDAQSLTRSINTAVRLKFEAHTEQKWADEALEELKSNNQYIRENARNRLDKSIKKIEDTVEKMKAHKEEMATVLEKIKKSQETASKYFQPDALLSTETIQKMMKYFNAEEK